MMTDYALIADLLNDALKLLERQQPNEDQWAAEMKLHAARNIAHQAHKERTEQ